jgi:hypothetical protein
MTATYRRLTVLGLMLAACTAAPTEPTPAGGPPLRAHLVDDSDIVFVQNGADAPPLGVRQVSFWAVVGQSRRASLYYTRRPGAVDSTELVRFRVDKKSLHRRPDGTPFAAGDSILITLTVVDTLNLIVDFAPSGLTFNPKYPARLWFKWTETNHDLDHDGAVTPADDTVRLTTAIHAQESVGAPWARLATKIDFASQDVEARPTSFTRYAVAY